jgi:hypothetical protein
MVVECFYFRDSLFKSGRYSIGKKGAEAVSRSLSRAILFSYLSLLSFPFRKSAPLLNPAGRSIFQIFVYCSVAAVGGLGFSRGEAVSERGTSR